MKVKPLKLLYLSLVLCSVQAMGKSALIIVDMQKCFVPGEDKEIHSLPVNGGRDIISGINKIQEQFDYIIATKDWHTADHVSFASQHKNKNPFETVKLENGIEQTLWPDHCVQNTAGAEFVEGLKTNKLDHIVYKGDHRKIDSYSGFFDNAKLGKADLDEYLKKNDVKDIYVVGLAADFCVKFTSLDGAFLKYNTYFVKDLTKAVFPENIETSTYSQLRASGVNIISSEEIYLQNK